MASAHDFTLDDITGKPLALSSLQGKVLLVVNVASQCGYTKQYQNLVALHERYASRGLLVLGFPANNFGAQEPGTNAEVAQFCSTKFGVAFPMFAKVSVKGADQHPLFAYLTSAANPDFTGDIEWNFEKALVGKDGRLLRRFRSAALPDGPEITAAVEQALAS
ncbi:MAG: glutathione peroxidase [Candidatus Latescibacteria bacterium]|nr:glutathione peroxidase [Candidatus Latescibacterota bacterium]